MKLYRRENYLSKIRGFYRDTGTIKVITGVRRCGKSCLMHTIVEELEENGVLQENIIFPDLRKRGYRSIKTPEQLEEVIDRLSTVSGSDILPPPTQMLRGGGFSAKDTTVSRYPELIGSPVPQGTVVFYSFTEAFFVSLPFSD